MEDKTNITESGKKEVKSEVKEETKKEEIKKETTGAKKETSQNVISKQLETLESKPETIMCGGVNYII
jgi:activator of 2-hydroxyglutaryl-CoA dehydratase